MKLLRTTFLLVAASAGACTTPQPPPNDSAAPDVGAADVRAVFDVAPMAPPPAYSPNEPHLRRLTQRQYANSIRDVLGATLVIPRALEPDTRTEGSSSIGGRETTISLRGTEQYQSAAYDLAEQVLRDPARRMATVSCTPSAMRDDVCSERFLREQGRRLWRRPLTPAELGPLVALAGRAAETLGDFHRGLEYSLAAVLQSPDFLFRVELGTPVGTERRYMGFDLATRLSYFLWDSTPDDALLASAEDGSLDTADGLAREVDRMIASPKARRGLEAFVTDWLRLGELDMLSRDAVLFPSFAADFGPSAREEVLRTTAWMVFDQDADFRDLLTTRETFVNRRLAALYGIAFPVREAPPTQFERLSYPESQPRRGLLGMAAFLALEAHPVSTSPTLRGKYVRELVLCERIPAPPVDVNTAIPAPTMQARTLRERLEQHREDMSCRGCHRLTDGIGLGFESFDAMGRYRYEDNGVEIDASGELDGIGYRDAAGLASVLREHPSFPRCVTNRLYRHAWGYLEAEPQREEVERLLAAFSASGYKMRSLLRTIAVGEAFRRATSQMVTPLPPLPDAGTTDASSEDGR